MPPLAATDLLPARQPIVGAPAIDVSSFQGKYSFFLSNDVEEIYTWAVEFLVYPDGSFILYVYSAATYAGRSCQQSVLDTTMGYLVVSSDPPVISFPPSTPGTGSFRDTCNPALNSDTPINFTFQWLVSPWGSTGSQWWFQNGDYSSPFNSFIVTYRGGVPQFTSTSSPA